MRRSFACLLILFGAGMLGCWWGLSHVGDLRIHFKTFLTLYGLCGAMYLGLLVAMQHKLPEAPRAWLTWIFLVAIVARFWMWSTAPVFSDDIYRYAWDAKVQHAGMNPYAHAPDSDELIALQDANYERMNFPYLKTVYPPGMQKAFWLAGFFGNSVQVQKTWFLLLEGLLVLGLILVLKVRRKSLFWLVAYLWHPLPILEIAGSGHHETLAVGLLWLGLWACLVRRWAQTALFWTGAFLSKFFSGVLMAWWFFRREGRWALALFVICSIIPILVWPGYLSALIGSLSANASGRVASNALVYQLFVWVAGAAVAPILALSVVGLVALVWGKLQKDPLLFCLGVFGAMILMVPALHPWYMLWVIPFFCFYRSWGLVLLSLSCVLAYAVWPGFLATGEWTLPAWAWRLEYVPVCLVLLVEMFVFWKKRVRSVTC